ncbi:MAG: hypothetical protein HC857_06560 [Synechococcales cyanobacterium RU_4_20]|nr:hypothetical protein [Synechococcales cyanobacterium RU_4_20]NJR70241.1 hypothetical protein [Synechococcales cyanobacterium CRU_2_2]
MINTALRDVFASQAILDIIDPVGPEFALYFLPNGKMLTYGWRFTGAPTEGHYYQQQIDGEFAAWIEVKQPRPREGDQPIYRIGEVTTLTRERPELNPEGLQKLHWVSLVEAIAA